MEKHLRIIINATLLTILVVFVAWFMGLSRQSQKLKTDQAEINHIRYGLFNVDDWSKKIAVVITEKIQEFEVTPENRVQIQGSLESVLYALIDEVEEIMDQRTSGTFRSVKRWIAGFAIDMDQLRDSVPSFAVTVLDELNNPENKEQMRRYLLDKLDEYKESGLNGEKLALLDTILHKYDCTNREDCQVLLQEKIEQHAKNITASVGLILIVVLMIYLYNLLPKRPPDQIQVPILIVASICLLIGGITVPMIELEARIDMLVFNLLGEQVIFYDQILFFQSKSISNVVSIMMQDGSLQMIFVGLLIFLFSIVFPTLKLISSYIYYQDMKGLRENKLIRFFVLKSGKWSMADVFVVALFMAYIGFNGIVSSQLDTFSQPDQPYEVFSTNGTELLGGFYLFLFFCLSSLALSEVLTRNAS